jgi:hypothetical protein
MDTNRFQCIVMRRGSECRQPVGNVASRQSSTEENGWCLAIAWRRNRNKEIMICIR